MKKMHQYSRKPSNEKAGIVESAIWGLQIHLHT